MALIVNVPIQGGFIVEDAYVRIDAVIAVKKNVANGSYYAVGDLAVYKDKAEADSREIRRLGGVHDGVSYDPEYGDRNGEQLQSRTVDHVKVTGVNIDNNIHQQLYAKLKTDLTAASITWAEE